MTKELQSFNLTDEERKKRDALKSKLGCEVFVLRAEGVTLYAREPTIPQMDCYWYEQLDDDTKSKAAVNLLRGCALDPSKEEASEAAFDAAFKVRMGAGLKYAMSFSFLRIAGIRAEVALGK